MGVVVKFTGSITVTRTVVTCIGSNSNNSLTTTVTIISALTQVDSIDAFVKTTKKATLKKHDYK